MHLTLVSTTVVKTYAVRRFVRNQPHRLSTSRSLLTFNLFQPVFLISWSSFRTELFHQLSLHRTCFSSNVRRLGCMILQLLREHFTFSVALNTIFEDASLTPGWANELILRFLFLTNVSGAEAVPWQWFKVADPIVLLMNLSRSMVSHVVTKHFTLSFRFGTLIYLKRRVFHLRPRIASVIFVVDARINVFELENFLILIGILVCILSLVWRYFEYLQISILPVILHFLLFCS